ncbi:MAG TPA: phosphopyruvate hydratase, partial [Capillimicrobium sp.]
MSTITALRGRQILDSRGRPTVEAQMTLAGGTSVIASVPSGASTGRHEAVERRDGDADEYGGLGVLGAVRAIDETIAPALRGMAPELAAIDTRLRELDGTPDKSRLGANALLAVSLATARAAAVCAGVPLWQLLSGDETPLLPLPMVNIISGGLHAGRQLDFQDFLVMPVGAERYAQALEWCVRIHSATARELEDRGLSTLKADEGGFGPRLASHAEALELLDRAVQRAGLRPGDDVVYALDVAATHFFDAATGLYRLSAEGRDRDGAGMADAVAELAARHPIASVEDPLAEDDWAAWSRFTERLGDRLQVVGDDLFTTNPDRVRRGIEERAANAVLVKMNQIGTLSETLEVVRLARQAGLRLVVSARS